MRRVLVGLLILLILAIAAYFVFSLDPKRKSNDQSEGINAIPVNAAAILRVKDAHGKWLKFLSTDYGKNLSQLKAIDEFKLEIQKTISNTGKNSALANALAKQELLISAHLTAVNKFDLLFVSKCQKETEAKLTKDVEKAFEVKVKGTKTFEQNNITTLKGKDQLLYLAFANDLALLSTSSILIEDAILQLVRRKPLNDQLGFAKLYKTADLELDANFFVNYKEFGKMMKIYGSKATGKSKRVESFGEWMEVDLKITNESLLFNGLSFVSDSSNSFLSTFKGLSAEKLDVASVLPSSVSFLSYMGFEDFKKMQTLRTPFLRKQQKLYQHQKNIKKINKARGIDLEQDLFKWLGKEFCFFITEGEQEDPYKNACVAIHANNIEQAIERLNKIEKSTPNTRHDSLNFMGHQIHNLGMVNFLPLTLGDFFSGANHTHYTILQDYVVFGNDVGNLKNIINSYMRGKTLIKDIHFNQFYENFNEESSYFVYLNPKRAKNFWKFFLKEEFANALIEQQELLNDFQGIGFQTVSKNKLFSTNLFTNYKIIKQDAAISLIECVIDTTYSKKPWVVTNHYTQEKELLLQDDKNNLYLINNVGKIIWKRRLNAPIVGEVHMIDRYRNKKYQYLFGNGKQLHLIDRNGKDVEGYPVTLNTAQTQGIAVMDYDKNRKYRILVPCGKKLFNYSGEGKIVKGWKFKGASATIANTPVLVQQKKKDYILFNDNNGKVFTLNRKGEARIEYKNSLPKNRNNYELVVGNSLKTSGALTTDTNGIILFQKMNDDIEPITTRNFTPNHQFHIARIGNIPVAVYKDEDEIYCYKLSKNQVSKISGIEGKSSFGIQAFSNNGKLIFCSTDKETNQIYAWNQSGELLENFPIEGNSQVLIKDINGDDKAEFIIGTKSGSLYIYSILN